jgi:catalase
VRKVSRDTLIAKRYLSRWTTIACSTSIGAVVAFASPSTQAQTSNLESVPAGEDQDIAEIVRLAKGELSRHYPEDKTQVVRRDAHAKAHGCVKASFNVDNDLPEDLRVGIFKPGQTYRAWIRFSNAAFEPGPDPGMDGRGMAIKLLDIPDAGDSSSSKFRTQDIVMVNYPVFFSPDAKDYRAFAEAGALTGDSAGLRRYFLPSYNPFSWRLRQAVIGYDIANQKIQSPLMVQYYSMVPYKFDSKHGVDRAVRYSAKRCDIPGSNVIKQADTTRPEYLKEAMVAELNKQSVCYSFFVQVRPDGMSNEDAKRSIEDATFDWDQTKSPFWKVANITIEKQSFDTAYRNTLCENMSFDPWNAIAEHTPLGGINRIRRELYPEISKYRHQRNHVADVDPIAAWEQ